MSIERTLVEYGKAWFEPDHDKRVELLRRCCTEDIVFVDPQLGRLEGLDAVSKMIDSYIASRVDPTAESEVIDGGRSAGGVSVEVVTPIDQMHGFFRYSFVWRSSDGSSSGGTDFCELAADGRMRLITVWPATDAFPLPPARV